MANAICNVFKEHLLKGNHNFSASGGDTYKIALYTSSKTVSATAITGYNATNEAANSAGSGYTAAGNTLTNAGVTGSSTDATAFCDFNDTSWTTVSTTARYAVIYQSSGGAATAGLSTDSAVCVLDFGGDFTTSAGTFTIQFPANDASNAIIRISG
jgi:hypothetical protein|tara:strand:+ start:163 stop:630 length:468 start_codon:yes stop_codon:yes gene_type:complete